jgi:succinylarginine dihydrolase
MQVREKVEKLRTSVFWSKSRLAKAAGAEPSSQIRDEKLHAVVAHLEVKMYKAHQVQPGSEHF